MDKIYEVHITSKQVTDPGFYFVEIATGKRYKDCKYPEGFDDLDDETKNGIVVFITNEGGVDETYGSYYFKKHPLGDVKIFGIRMYERTCLCMKLTEYGERCERKKRAEADYEQAIAGGG